jgi:hypothetical protein
MVKYVQVQKSMKMTHVLLISTALGKERFGGGGSVDVWGEHIDKNEEQRSSRRYITTEMNVQRMTIDNEWLVCCCGAAVWDTHCDPEGKM